MDKPGQIIYFDHKGEVMDATSFNPGANYADPEPSGGFGMHEIGNRGTQLGMNIYANTNTKFSSPSKNKAPSASSSVNSKYAPTEDVDDFETDETSTLFPKVVCNKTPSGSQFSHSIGANQLSKPPPCLASGTSGSETAKDELDLLAKLIGTDVKVDQQESKSTFRIHLLDMNNEESAAAEPEEKAEAKLKADEALEFDMKGTARKRDNLLSKIAGDMEQGNAAFEANDDPDDLLALMDKAS